MIEDVSQVMTKHITNILSGVIGEYTVYKETHDTIMGLPCVRRLQERINELEMPRDNSGGESVVASECGGGAPSREDEIHQLQSAIAELNRYIVALESKVDMKTVYSPPSVAGSTTHNEEESIRLEIHENTFETMNHESEFVVPCSNSKNVIITSSTIPEEPEDDTTTEDLATGGDDAEADSVAEEEEEAEAEAEEDTEADAVVEAEEEDMEADAVVEAEEEAEEAEADEEAEEDTEADAVVEAEEAEEDTEADAVVEAEEAEADEEAEDTEADAVVEAEEAEEDTEADAVVEAEEEAEEAEAEIEVSEVKIKGKTYFTTDPQNGIIYACVDDDVGDEVGVFKNGVAVFNKGKK
jgi:hypothetical protein